ncbi:aldose 1-epimerase family protein [Algoriphagus resistens]|uniref:aldose 1-epimerase family protein n=1 Tax=Algoriphagus resistens TaxID=1750590 RepID=UPI0007168B55|nr:aldose 1-epimerase family protein [Algoriphagus resistens]
MNFTLESTDLSVKINPVGMELSSIQSKTTGLEYLWQADPAIWKGHAPVLFPIVGALKGGYTTINGKKYEMPKHGLVRNSSKPKLISHTNTTLALRLTWDEESLQKYPYKFQLDMVFSLVGNTLTIKHIVTNQSDESMLYSIGGHPAFNCPLLPDEKYADYSIEFAQPETDATWLIDEAGLIKNQTKPFLENSSSIHLRGSLFDDDALIFKYLKSREVTLRHQSKGAILSVQFEDFEYLGIWAKPGAPFVCIEPWLGIGDSSDSNQQFEEKEGLLNLEPNQSHVKTYSITIL